MPDAHSSDDDRLPGLPSLDGVMDDEPDESMDLGDALDGAFEGDDESVGLDAEAADLEGGFGELLDDLGDEGERLASWDDVEEGAVPEDPELGNGDDESGWADGAETSQVEGWDEDLVAVEEGQSFTGDAGDEGVEDELAGHGDLDAVSLPPLRADLGHDADADDLDLEGDAQVEIEDFDGPADLPLALAVARYLGPEGEPVIAACPGWACHEARLLRVVADAHALPSGVADVETPLRDGESPVSVVAIEERVIVGLGLGGMLVSGDRGASFERVAVGATGGPLSLLLEARAGDVPRVWALARGGGLHRSEDAGRSWSMVHLAGAARAFAVADGVVRVVVGGALLCSRDGGRRWHATDLPELAAQHPIELACQGQGDHLALACGPGPLWLSRDGGASFAPVPLLRGARSLAVQGGAVYAALYLEGQDRGLLARYEIGEGSCSVVFDTAEAQELAGISMTSSGPDSDRRIIALSEGARGELFVATGIGLFALMPQVEGPGGLDRR